MDKIIRAKKRITDALLALHPTLCMGDPKQEELYLALHDLNNVVSERARAELLNENSGLNIPVVMPCFCLKCGSAANILSERSHYECSNEDCKQLYTVMMSDDGQTCLAFSNKA